MEPEAPKHVCGQCQNGFATEEEYLAHTCEKTGYKPTQPEHTGQVTPELAAETAPAEEQPQQPATPDGGISLS